VHHVLHECVVGCPILSSMYEHVPIYHRGVGIDKYCNHVVLGASHPTCVSYIAWMSCRIFVWRTSSHSTAHVMSWTVLLRALFALWLLTFALIATLVWRILRYVLALIATLVCPSVLSYWMIGVRDKISHVLTERAWVRGVGIDLTLQSCSC